MMVDGGGRRDDKVDASDPAEVSALALVEDLPAYLLPLLTDFSRLAEQAGHDHLAYLLELARLEADALSAKDNPIAN